MLFMYPAVATVPFEADTCIVTVKQFNKAAINDYKKYKDFKYREDESPQQNGIWGLIVYYFFRFLSKIFSTRVGHTNTYNILLYCLMIFGVIMLIFQFLKISPQGLLSRSSPVIAVNTADGENIHEINFDKLISQSTAQHDYRLAVRFWYLKMLKVLSDAQFINWQISKTNYDYYYELKQQALRDEFLKLTTIFENSWYGNHNLNDEGYKDATKAFDNFFTNLNHRGR